MERWRRPGLEEFANLQAFLERSPQGDDGVGGRLESHGAELPTPGMTDDDAERYMQGTFILRDECECEVNAGGARRVHEQEQTPRPRRVTYVCGHLLGNKPVEWGPLPPRRKEAIALNDFSDAGHLRKAF